ncbi:MAG: hypothetical protein NTZ02_04310 [Candidatus Woesearchaeota archaeon]|nr:hypothetical protein [Candidatus Woesearchaeota archaeon]
MLFYKKRSESDVQLNWIFILIAGAVFLFIVFKAINFQRASAELSASVALKSSFDAAVASSMTQEDFSGQIDVGKTGINFSCGSAILKGLNPSDLGAAFAPGGISSDSGKVIIKSEQWKFPLRISGDNPSDLADEISGRKGKDIRLVFFGQEPTSNLLKNASIIKIEPKIRDSINYGTVTFYSRDGSKTSTYYFGDEMLIAAIYSGSIADYECSAAKAFDRLYWILSMSQIRLANMSKAYAPGQSCNGLLNSTEANSARDNILALMSLIAPLTKDGGLRGLSEENATAIADKVNAIESNNNLLVRFSCPSIY